MEAPRKSQEDVRELLGNPRVIIIDVRRDQGTAREKIPGASMENPDAVERWRDKYAKDREMILYCS